MPPGVAITTAGWRLDDVVERAPLVAAVGRGAVERVDLARRCSRPPSRSRGSARRTAAPARRPAARRASTCRRRAGRPARCAGRAPDRAGRRRTAPPARPGRGAARPRCGRCSSSRIISHSGELVVTSPTSSASAQSSAVATCCSTRIEALPTPYSRLARWRSETPDASATALRVRPRRARSRRTRSPSATRNGALAAARLLRGPGLGSRHAEQAWRS